MSLRIGIWICVMVSAVYSQDDIIYKVDTFVNETMNCYQVPGMNLVVVKDEQILLSKGYGFANLDKKTPVTTKTMFCLASTTKAFVATTLAHVVADTTNSLTWDSPVKDVIGDWFHLSDPYRSSHVNLKDLLGHRVGLPQNNPVRLIGLSREELMRRMRFFNTTRNFRDEWMYNNLLYGVAGFAGEKVKGKPWEDLCREYIYTPLNMTSSTFFPQARDRWEDEFATPYMPYNSTMREISKEVAGSFYGTITSPGGVATNAEDMGKWLLFHLNGGKDSTGKQIISKSHLEDTYKPYMTHRNADKILKPVFPVTASLREKYGLGWNIGQYKGHRSVMHTGNMNGYHSQLALLPDKHIGFYMSFNGHRSGRSQADIRDVLHAYIMDLLLGDMPWLNTTTACSFPEPWIQASTNDNNLNDVDQFKATRPLKDYVGTFGHFGYGNVSVSLNETSQELYLQYSTAGHWILTPTSRDNEFTGVGQEPHWYSTLSNTIFSTSNSNVITKVTIRAFERAMPPEFIRNLKMSDAPKPPSEETCKPPASSALRTLVSFHVFIAAVLKSIFLL